MNNDIKKHMQQYNALISRYKKAEQFYENENISMELKLKHIHDMKALVNKLDSVMKELVKMGHSYTNEEILEGFKGV